MLTKKDRQLLVEILHEVITEKFLSIDKGFDRLNHNMNTYSKKLDSLHAKLNKFLRILDRYEKRQQILEKKIEAIEDYFDPLKN